MLDKIISGGQTGADRAALDWAIEHSISHGGWCPKGRMAEDGKIDSRYQLEETPSQDYAQRTQWNVRDSDATLIFSISQNLLGGSLLTKNFAIFFNKPYLHFSKGDLLNNQVIIFNNFLIDNNIKVLNVAGARISQEPEIYQFVYDFFDLFMI